MQVVPCPNSYSTPSGLMSLFANNPGRAGAIGIQSLRDCYGSGSGHFDLHGAFEILHEICAPTSLMTPKESNTNNPGRSPEHSKGRSPVVLHHNPGRSPEQSEVRSPVV